VRGGVSNTVVDDRGVERPQAPLLSVWHDLMGERPQRSGRQTALLITGKVVCLALLALWAWWFIRTSPGTTGIIAAVTWFVCAPLVGILTGWLLRRRAERSTIKSEHAAVFASYGRCGCCAFDLIDLPVQEDGCTVCSECGCAWNRLRFTRRTPGMTASEAADACMKELARRPRLGEPVLEFVCDDIGVRTAFKGGSMLGWSLRGRTMQANAALRSAAWKRRVPVIACLVLVGTLLLAATFGPVRIPLAEPLYTGAFGVCALLFAVFATRLSLPFAKRRALWLAHGVCPSCLSDMDEASAGFNGCRVCVRCGCSWRAADLAFPPVRTECEQCGYDRAGLTRGTPCPECACLWEVESRRVEERA